MFTHRRRRLAVTVCGVAFTALCLPSAMASALPARDVPHADGIRLDAIRIDVARADVTSVRVQAQATGVPCLVGPLRTAAGVARFYTSDTACYPSVWFGGRHRLKIPYGCTSAPYFPAVAACGGRRGFHRGIDLDMPIGTPIYAGLDGTIVRGALAPKYGPDALILRTSRWDVVLGHLIGRYVTNGQKVAAGALIGWAGQQGAPDGPQLHFEVRPVGKPEGAAVNPAAVLQLGSSGSPMTPAEAEHDAAPVGECQVSRTARTTPKTCVFGNPRGTQTMVLFGDSHATGWFPAVDAIARLRGWRLFVFSKASCPPADVTVINGRLGRIYSECADWRNHVVQRLAEIGVIDALVIGRIGNYDTSMIDESSAPVADAEAEWKRGLTSLLNRLVTKPKSIIVMRDAPVARWNVPSCLRINAVTPVACNLQRGLDAHADAILARAEASITGVRVVDVTDKICPSVTCAVVLANGTIVYRDSNHLTATYARSLALVIGRRAGLLI